MVNSETGDVSYIAKNFTGLEADRIDIWIESLDQDESTVSALKNILSMEENSRAQRIKIPEARKHFIVARGFLRYILAGYLGIKVTELVFSYGENGKPELADNCFKDKISFNLSHSHGLGIYAVTGGRPIGVDIEKIRENMDFLRIGERFFAPDEARVLKALPEKLQKQAFFNCWTRKEALLKATGEGISSRVDLFEVSLEPGKPAVLVKHPSGPEEASKWTLIDMDVDPGFVSALAVRGQAVVSKQKNILDTINI